MTEPSEPGPALAQEAQAPEEAAPRAPPVEPPTIWEMARQAPITFALAAVNISVFLWAERSGSTTTTATLLQFGAVERIHVWAGEPWRLVTSMFLHIGWIHLLWNTYASIGWCAGAERAIGRGRFLFVYLVSGVGAACASVICHDVPAAGASGAMFGIVGVTLVLWRRALPSWDDFFRNRAVRSILINIGVWTVIGLTAVAMDNYAHGGGLVVGAAAAWILTDRQAGRSSWLVFAAAFAALFVAALRPWWHPTGADADRVAAYADWYRMGKELPLDSKRARRIAERGCEARVPSACIELGLLLRENGDAPSVAKADALFHEICASGDDNGCAAEGYAIATGAASADERNRGLVVVSRMCEKGNQWACRLKEQVLDGKPASDR
jgi:rhomboid protease GluP